MDYYSVIKDEDCIKISKKAIYCFKNYLNKEELEQCRHIGIWKACLTYNNKFKFYTFMFNNIKWECYKLLRENNKQLKYIPKLINKRDIIQELRINLKDIEYKVLYKKFIESYTIKQIAKELNITKTEISKILKSAIKNAKEVLS